MSPQYKHFLFQQSTGPMSVKSKAFVVSAAQTISMQAGVATYKSCSAGEFFIVHSGKVCGSGGNVQFLIKIESSFFWNSFDLAGTRYVISVQFPFMTSSQTLRLSRVKFLQICHSSVTLSPSAVTICSCSHK